MADNSNNSKENSEKDEDKEVLKKNKKESLKKAFIKEYVKSWLKKWKDKASFLNSIFNSENKVSDSIRKDMETLNLLYTTRWEDIDLDEISNVDLKKEAIPEYSRLINKRNSIKWIFLRDYNISNDEYNKKISWNISNLEEKEIDELIQSDSKRLEFSSKILWKKVLRKNFIDFLGKFDILKRYKKLTDENQRLFLSFYEINLWWNHTLKQKIDINDIIALFDSWIFWDEEKKDILSKFACSVDLKKALIIGLIKKKDVKKIKLSLIEEEFWEDLTEDEKKALLSKIKSEDINIDLNHECINNSLSNFNEILKIISLDSIVESCNDFMKKIIEKSDKVIDVDIKAKKDNLDKEDNWTAFNLQLKKNNIDNFIEWNILILKTEDDKWENKSINFYKIIDLWNTTWKVKLIDKTVNNRYSENKSVECNFSQKNIISILEKWNFSEVDKSKGNLILKDFKCYDDQTFKNELRDTENEDISEAQDELSLFTEDELEEKRNNIDKEDKYYKEKVEQIDKLNLDILKWKIDDLDANGKKFWFQEWLTFETKWDKKKWKSYFTITKINSDNSIDIENITWLPKQTLSFEAFFEWWEWEKAKRISKASSMEDVFSDLWSNWDIWEEWSQFKFKDNWIYKKEGNKSLKCEYDYLVSTKWKELIKIHSISWDRVQISFWEVEQKTKDEKDQKDWESKIKTTFSVEENIHNVNIWFLDSWIRKNSLTPRALEEEKDVEETDIEATKMHWSFISRMFDRLSVAQLLAWWKLYIDAVENYLKEWQDELSARFANSLWLPEELKSDLVSREEAAKKKRMDDYIQKLKNVDSGPATKMIEWWLLNKDAPQYQKEAWLMFMMEKYWVLYAKFWLYKHKWNFLWYQSLGWKIWDPLFQEVKAEAKKANQTFTEEELIFRLLIKQCRWNWHNWIKRASRLHKDFKNLRSSWKEEENKSWKQDAWDISNGNDVASFIMWELTWWTYANAIWWFESFIDSWTWTMEEMNKIPFVMLFSWSAYSMEAASRKVISELPYAGKVIPILGLMRNESGIDVATDLILELSKKIQEKKWWKYPWIWDEAQKIFDNMKSTSVKEVDKIKQCEKFYDKYSSVLTQALYWLNNAWKSEDTYISNMIFLEKDDRVDENWNELKWNSIFKKYSNEMSWLDSWYKYTKDYMEDALMNKWMSWFSPYKLMKHALAVNSWGSYVNSKWWPAIIQEMLGQIIFYSQSKDLSTFNKRKLIIKNLKWIIWAALELSIDSLSRSRQLDPFFNKLWINLDELKNMNLERWKLNAYKKWTSEYDYLNNLTDNLIWWTVVGSNSDTEKIDISDILSWTKEQADNVISK